MTPAMAIRARAVELLQPGDDVQIATDTCGVSGQVLVGIARAKGPGVRSLVLTIPLTEYEAAGGYKAFAAAIGMPLREPTAMERAALKL